MKKIAFLLCIIFCFSLSGCSSAPVKNTYFALDTVITTEIYGENAKAADSEIFALVNRLGNELDPDNAVLSGDMSADSSVYQLAKVSLSLSHATDGCFDITVDPYTKAWGWGSEENRVPSAGELAELADSVGYQKVKATETGFILPEGGSITFGAVAKGFISDAVYAALEKNEIESAVISLGGNIILKGSDTDGNPWKIGIESPAGDGTSVATLSLSDCFAVTSGDYHRCFTQDGVSYHHIIDPATGYPAQSDLRSVTVIGKSGTAADAFSTAMFVMGQEKAIKFWRESDPEFDFVLITKSGEMVISQGLSGKISDIGQEYTLKTVKK